MSQDTASRHSCTSEEIDEAAVWIARLRAPDRTVRLERGLRRWLAEKPSHVAAFEIVSNAWELAGALQPEGSRNKRNRDGARVRPRLFRAATAVAGAAALVVAGALFQAYDAGISTAVGEQRVLSLEDGTRIFLNTASRIVVRYDDRARHVELETGEALFEVSKRQGWPFVVTAGNRQITALGTSFVVREEHSMLSVTLIEGRVAVIPDASLTGAAPAASLDAEVVAQAVTLQAGERLTLREGIAAPRIDRPQLERLTAWRNGQVEFEDTTLAAAVQEMNRYSKLKLTVDTPDAERIRINGVFRVGDTAGFAAAVARSYGLGVEWRAREGVIRGAIPSAAPERP